MVMVESDTRRRFFPDAFKLEAVAAVRGGRPVTQVAAELGLPDRSVRSWLRWAEVSVHPGQVHTIRLGQEQVLISSRLPQV